MKINMCFIRKTCVCDINIRTFLTLQIKQKRKDLAKHMKLLKVLNIICRVLLVAVLFVIYVPVCVCAVSKSEINKLGSITIDLSKSEVPVTGMNFTVYKIGDFLSLGDYTLTKEFFDSGIQLDELSNASKVTTASKELANYAESKNINGILKTIGENKTVVFNQLTLGYYLVVQTGTVKGYKGSSICDPFVLSLPMAGINGSGWIYKMLVYPKIGTVSDPTGADDPNDSSQTTDSSDTGENKKSPDITPTEKAEETDIIDELLPGGPANLSKTSDIDKISSSSAINQVRKDILRDFNLPKTGGSIAYALCSVGGIALIGCGVTIFIVSRRKKNRIK
jgi:hypothetical protein